MCGRGKFGSSPHTPARPGRLASRLMPNNHRSTLLLTCICLCIFASVFSLSFILISFSVHIPRFYLIPPTSSSRRV